MEKIICIVGPTAVGKTMVSIKIAKKFNGEIISADSVQIYKGFDIGSAKVTEEEKENIVHHMLDIVEPNQNYSVGQYVETARKIITDIIKRGKTPIIVGGTGLYVNSLIFDMGVTCGNDPDYRAELEEIAKKEGSAKLHEMLEKVDKESADAIHPNHKTRIIRALEIYHLTGKKKSECLSSTKPHYDYLLLGLTDDRDVLYQRINDRVDKMIDAGLLEEVQGLIEKGLNLSHQSMQGIGFKETYAYLTNMVSKEEFIEKLKQNSRNYAKRQFTYFKKMPNIIWTSYKEQDNIDKQVADFLNAK